MFSKELENLIEATLADGILEEHEKAALVKRAQKENVDLDELEIYIQSILQKRTQNQKVQMEKETAAHEKERRGNVCPHCGTQIPPMTKLCPNCGKAVSTNETAGDKELFQLIDDISNALVDVKAANDKESYIRAKAKCESLLKKADLFYGDNQKIQMLKFDLEAEMKKAFDKFKTPIGVRIISAIILLLLCCTGWVIIVAFFEPGRKFLGSTWDKVIAKD